MNYNRKNPTNYKMMHNMLGNQNYRDMTNWTNLWGVQNGGVRENFFVGYAMEGAISKPSSGNRAGLPARHNLCNSPVSQPSPLNSENTIQC